MVGGERIRPTTATQKPTAPVQWRGSSGWLPPLCRRRAPSPASPFVPCRRRLARRCVAIAASGCCRVTRRRERRCSIGHGCWRLPAAGAAAWALHRLVVRWRRAARTLATLRRRCWWQPALSAVTFFSSTLWTDGASPTQGPAQTPRRVVCPRRPVVVTMGDATPHTHTRARSSRTSDAVGDFMLTLAASRAVCCCRPATVRARVACVAVR